MPEGPEVWILSKAINEYYDNNKTYSVGKHLIIKDISEDWSFGLTGKVEITETNTLEKVNFGYIFGEKLPLSLTVNMLALDWMQTNISDLEAEIKTWSCSKKKLAGLMLDQRKICGIGVAWGSEILFNANLCPDKRACDQDLSNLAKAMIEKQEQIKSIYQNELYDVLQLCRKHKNNDLLKEFINEWFKNLYEIREMKIYKNGTKTQVLGRSWWT
jgi:formamidopyrimidine-DNA glycosylase